MGGEENGPHSSLDMKSMSTCTAFLLILPKFDMSKAQIPMVPLPSHRLGGGGWGGEDYFPLSLQPCPLLHQSWGGGQTCSPPLERKELPHLLLL